MLVFASLMMSCKFWTLFFYSFFGYLLFFGYWSIWEYLPSRSEIVLLDLDYCGRSLSYFQISFIELFSSQISVWFLVISISVESHSDNELCSWFQWIIYLYSLIYCWVFLRLLFWISFKHFIIIFFRVYYWGIIVFFWGVVSLLFRISCVTTWKSLHLVKQLLLSILWNSLCREILFPICDL